MAGSTAAPDGDRSARPDDAHDPLDPSALQDEGHGAAHVHVFTASQEEAFCWTAACFVVAAIVFAIWTLRTVPGRQGKTQRKTRRKKCRAGRSAKGVRGKRR